MNTVFAIKAVSLRHDLRRLQLCCASSRIEAAELKEYDADWLDGKKVMRIARDGLLPKWPTPPAKSLRRQERSRKASDLSRKMSVTCLNMRVPSLPPRREG